MERADPRDESRAVGAARKVLLELHQVLGEFRDAMTVVGGSAPPLLQPEDRDDPYVGTTDVDVVLELARPSSLLPDPEPFVRPGNRRRRRSWTVFAGFAGSSYLWACRGRHVDFVKQVGQWACADVSVDLKESMSWRRRNN